MPGNVLFGYQIARVLILTSVNGAAAADADVRARIDDEVELVAAVELTRPGHRGCLIASDASQLASRCKRVEPPPGWSIAWSKVEAGQKAYDNVPGGDFDAAEIDWVESPWVSGAWRVRADVAPVVRAGIKHGAGGRASRAGTMRYRVTLTAPDEAAGATRVVASPLPAGLAGGPPRALDARKISLRLDDSYLGYMTELGGLPYIFGSTALGREPHQAERAIGVDCADLVIYGLRRQGQDLDYRSSRTLAPVSRAVAHATGARAGGRYVDASGRYIRVGPGGVAPGDWLIFAGHVGAFFEDRGATGILDEEDLMIHIAWRELAVEPLSESGYGDVRFEVRRPADR